MANKHLFRSLVAQFVPAADTRNSEGAPAYALSPKHALAQHAATGCLNATYYASAAEQLDRVLALCAGLPADFVAKTAVYARRRGFMKDMPALLCAVLSVKSPELLATVFDRVIDDGKMLRSFVQVVRSGVAGRKSLGTRPKKLVERWLASRSDDSVFRASVGNDPSLADVVRMVHPKPADPARNALYAWLLGRRYDAARLPQIVQRFEHFKRTKHGEVPDVPFQMLTALDLGTKEWTAIAKSAPWQTTRMNLNTFARHGVFGQAGLDRLIADRLRDPDSVRRARAFPYQLMVAARTLDVGVPRIVQNALHDAMELALENVPAIDGRVYVLPDVSGSMRSPATGSRRGSTTAVRCVDVAALVAAAILRKNPGAEVLPFEHRVVGVELDPYDSVMTNATKLASVGGGGTSCSAPLALLNRRKAKGNLVVFVSDSESWVDARHHGTATMQEWHVFKGRNPEAKMCCIDIVPNRHTQAKERDDILNVGGFSDVVFELLTAFATERWHADAWVAKIEEIQL